MGFRSGSAVREVVRRGEPRLVIDFRYRDEEGRRRRYRRDATVQSLDAARAEAQRLKDQGVNSEVPTPKPPAMLFGEFAEGAFSERYMARRCRPATRERYGALLRRHILKVFGSLRLDEITSAHLRAYEAELVGSGIQPRPHLSLIRTVLRLAVRRGELDRIPEFHAASRPRKTSSAPPTTDEVERLFACAEKWLRVAIALAAFGGLTVGEICALQVDDIKLNEGCLNVWRTISGFKRMPLPSGRKRIVQLGPELEGLLTEVVEKGADRARVVRDADHPRPRRQRLLAALKQLQTRCGLRPHSFQALRRSRAQLASASHGMVYEEHP